MIVALNLSFIAYFNLKITTPFKFRNRK